VIGMANVLLGVTGSVAAIHTGALYYELTEAGHSVKVVATNAAQYFFDTTALAPVGGRRNREVVILDEDEWPGRADGHSYQRGDPVVHIELRRWADIFLIAPLDANTLAKLASGLCDNCLTCVWRAWERHRPVVLAPAMNTLMWENPLTRRHLAQLALDAGASVVPGHPGLPDLVDWINANCLGLKIVAPAVKKLACEDVGVGAMAERAAIVNVLNELRVTPATPASGPPAAGAPR
jgi:phosphopantothenoylcysteine decarboxylase